MAPQSQQDQALHDLELKISKMLRSGVYISGALMSIGWIWQWIVEGDTLATFQTYEQKSLYETLHWAVVMQNRPLIISIAGLAVLVLLPITRVFLTGILFVKQKDRILALMAFAVFFCLVASFFLGIDL
ncbi:DUF1634 domain-containing protein [Bdellovibrio sp. SKB1291214]|uniref:DUF1634 domain-containing protein n=1 Tax=Bdellovibrio sp. SKB1291214 TaxID=1732569 RepID=UPI000B518E7D|nr:DUF1634 domain-containing protein [Bdellovibrio sp. SKB1291214]UYL07904.1 DUF1634 domain-containing protein [Bdellovibrio sp. SKB1291214]